MQVNATAAPGRWSAQFAARATRYRALHGGWSHKTHFFAAAAVTNRALAAAARVPPPLSWLSSKTLEFLFELGGELEAFNLRVVAGRSGLGRNIAAADHYLVELEQRQVDRHMEQLRQSDHARYCAVVAETDRLLHATAELPRLALPSALHIYASALREALEQFDGCLTFANRLDREQIGLGVIRQLAAG